MDSDTVLFVTQILPFILISLYTFLRSMGPVSIGNRSDAVFDNSVEEIFSSDDWLQLIDVEQTESAIADISSSELREILEIVHLDNRELRQLFRTYTTVVHRGVQVRLDTIVTAIAGMAGISVELLTNEPESMTTLPTIAGFGGNTVQSDLIILLVIISCIIIGLILSSYTPYCFWGLSPFHYRSEQQATDAPRRIEPLWIMSRKSTSSYCEWIRNYANPWFTIVYNLLAIGLILLTGSL